MTTREAAWRVVSDYSQVGEPWKRQGFDSDVVTVAVSFLRDHRVDDDVQVSVEWLVSAGFSGDPISTQCFHVQECNAFVVWFQDHIYPYILVGDDPIGHRVPGLATRGKVRRLCRALGFELKESA